MMKDEQLLRATLHDAANQLAVVMAALELLGENPLPRRISQAQEAARQAGELLQSAMTQASPPPEAILADEELGDSLALLRATLGRGIRLDVLLGAEKQALFLPRAQLHTTAVNLLLNARRALDGKGRVSLVTENVSQDGRVYWAMTVTDNGPGVPADRREAIFAPGGSFSPGGHGLGLSHSRAMARKAGGDLVLLPTEQGAGFRLLLPVDEGAAACYNESRMVGG